MYSNAYKRYVTGLLLVVYILNQTDRAIFGFLMEPIKRELGLSDTQLAFLAGPALVVLYAALGIPVARLADRSRRVNIIAIAVALWSAIVTCSASVTTFWQFALARIGVGVGEAGFSAVAQSLISDYHPAKERTRALSIFMLAIPLGGVISSLLAGWINQLYGWRMVFIAAGVPGIVLALLMKSTVHEPTRGGEHQAAQLDEQPGMRTVLTALSHRPTLKQLLAALSLVNVVTCILGWFPVFFMRNHDMPSGELGTWYAATAGLGGSAGIWLGGYLTTRYGAKDERVKVRLMALTSVLIVPMALIALWCPFPRLALILLLPLHMLMFFCYGPTFSLVQGMSPAGMRATMASVFILAQVLAGGVIGVQLLGILSDALTSVFGNSATALRWSMTLTTPLALWAAIHFWLGGKSIRQDALEAVPAVAFTRTG